MPRTNVPVAGEEEELQRIRDAYTRRKTEIRAGYYSRFRVHNLLSHHERELAMAALLREEGIESLAGLRILDLGCGFGATLRLLLEYGADPERLFGLDLIEDRLFAAYRLSPHLQYVCANAAQLPFPDGSFDLVSQYTVFTSVLDFGLKTEIAKAMLRVLSPAGRLLWYDFAYDNPRNPDVRGIGRAEIGRLFPGCSIRTRRVILAPPVGRLVARVSPVLYQLLASIRLLCTHYMCVIEKGGRA